MEVRLSHSFAERIRAVDPEHADVCNAALPVMLVSPKGAVVEKTVADSWAKGSFDNAVDSLEYHFVKHGGGRRILHAGRTRSLVLGRA